MDHRQYVIEAQPKHQQSIEIVEHNVE